MSICISKHGEFSEHQFTDQRTPFLCQRCWHFDEDAAIAAVHELVEAIRFTVEYVGTDMLRPAPGWAWFDALVKYAPDLAAAFREEDTDA